MKKTIFFIILALIILVSGCTYKWYFSLSVNTIGEGKVLINGIEKSFLENVSKHSSVNLNAISGAGWFFEKWSDDSRENPINIEIKDNTEITAYFTKEEFPIDINISGNGKVKIIPEKSLYEYGETVVLIAEPDEKYSFAEWTGDINSFDNIEQITIDSTKSIVANFVQDKFDLNINSIGQGIVLIDPVKEYYDLNEIVNISAYPSKGWEFHEWTGDSTGTNKDIALAMNSDKEITAIFSEKKYTLDLTVNGNGILYLDPKKENYSFGEIVELTALASPGSSFNNWTGDLSGNTNPVLIKINENKNITGNFLRKKYEISISTEGMGKIIIDPDKDFYYYGDYVSFQAVPESGWSFNSWSGDILSVDNPFLHKITESLNLLGVFRQNEYTIDIGIFGKGNVIVDPFKEIYHYDDSVNITAEASPGWEFDKWIGDIDSREKSIDLNINSNLNISAIFLTTKSSTPVIEEAFIPENIHSGDNFTIGATITDKENDIDNIYFQLTEKVTPNKSGDYYWGEFTAPSSVSTFSEEFKIHVEDSNGNYADYETEVEIYPNEWLVMIYMAGDNNLQNFAWEDILEMSNANFSQKIKLVVLYDRKSPDLENDHLSFSGTRRYLIKPGDTDLYEDLGELNTGDVDVLKDFVSWSIEKYNGKMKFLILWDHGDGWYEYDTGFDSIKETDGYICKDITASDALDMEDLKIFDQWVSSNYGKIDIVGFDACLMQMIEVGYELRECTNYIIASAGYVPSFGFPYKDIMDLFISSNITPESLCVNTADSFIDSSNIETTISIIKPDKYANLINSINSFSQAVITESSTEIINSIEQASKNSQFYDNYYRNIDLRDLMTNITSDIPLLEDEALDLIDEIDDLIYYSNGKGEYESSSGLSIWYSDDIQFNQEISNYKDISFASDGFWDEFLEEIYK